MRLKLTLCGWLLLLVGCASRTSIDRTAFGVWSDCYRLSNGKVEVIVAQSAGRIVRYAYVGGANQLWQNPATDVTAANGWQNYGGDKAWVWPQDQWPQMFGRVWPPPREMDGTPWTPEVVDRSTLRLTSPEFHASKLRLVREIHIEGDGTTVTIDTQLIAGAGSTLPLAPWTVTQIAPPDVLLAHVTGGKPPEKAWSLLQPGAWPVVTSVEAAYLLLQPPKDGRGKIGLDVDSLTARHGDVLLTIAAKIPPDAPPFAPAERAQVFSLPPTDHGKPLVPYYELEFTAPRQAMAAGQSLHLITVWSLTHVQGDASTASIVKTIGSTRDASPSNP